MNSHTVVEIADPSQVGEARRTAGRLAEAAGFDASDTGRAALLATELATNLVRHARGGRVLFAAGGQGGEAALDIVSVDQGPGMADPRACLRDGYSTAGTPGNGLGAVQRVADEFSITSTPGRGTIVLARLRAKAPAAAAAPAFRCAGLSLSAPGETVCGDGWAVDGSATQARVIVADGLGHGAGAHEAAQAALRVFADAAQAGPAALLDRAHLALRPTRGAAVAIAQLDSGRGEIVFAGAGNVCGRIVSGVDDRTLLSQHGTVGMQIRRPQEIVYPWPEHALLVLHSDGIATRWTLADTPGLLQCDPAVIAAWLMREHRRGRDDATVVVTRRR